MRIGLTGTIGSGKTTVSRRLAALGAHIIDADKVARDIVEPGMPCLERLAGAFGSGIIREDGTLDRRALANEAFADADKLALLGSITQPEIVAEMGRRADAFEKTSNALIVLDAALLFELNMTGMVNESWLVTASDETAIERVMARDGCSRQHVLDRMAAQMSVQEKRALADVEIANDGDIESLYERVDTLYTRAFLHG